MGVLQQTAKAIGHAIENVRAGTDKIVSRTLASSASRTIHVTSPTFLSDAPLPVASTVDGAGTPPPIAWSAVPAGTRSIAIVVEDPDAPFPEPFVHWIVYGIPADAKSIDFETVRNWREGKNSKLASGFTPAAPPPGHGTHRYHFQVFALDVAMDEPAGLGRRALVRKMKGHVLGWGEIIGVYQR